MKIKRLLVFFTVLQFFFSGEESALAGGENFGLGPLEIRPQFLVNQPFLAMSPENTLTLKGGETRLSIGKIGRAHV